MDTVLKNVQAQRHIREGFIRRFMMMKASRLNIQEQVQGRGNEPLSSDEATSLNIYLNSYYHNLSGALDNLAWILSWELQLLAGLNEDDAKSRRFCNLFGKDLLQSLSANHPRLSQLLGQHHQWYRDVRNLRDPGAHRIPLSFVGSVLEPQDAEEYREAYQQRDELLEQSSKAVQEGDFGKAAEYTDQAMAQMQSAEMLGRFVPIIVTSEASGRQIRSAPNQLQIDHGTFLTISGTVLRELIPQN